MLNQMPDEDFDDLKAITIEDIPSSPPPPVRVRDRHHSGHHGALGAVGPDPSELVNLPSPAPHNKIKRQNARKAVRRSKSAFDSGPSRRPLTELDPREPYTSWSSDSNRKNSRNRTRQFSLPEGQNPPVHHVDPDLFVTSKYNPDIQFVSGETSVTVAPAEVLLSRPKVEEESGGQKPLPPIPTPSCTNICDSPEIQFRPRHRPPSGRSADRRRARRGSPKRGASVSDHVKAVVVDDGLLLPASSTPLKDLPGYVADSQGDDDSSSPNLTLESCSTGTSDLSSQTPSSAFTPSTSRSVTPSTYYTPESSRPSSITDTSDFSTSCSEDSPYIHKFSEKSSLPDLDEKSESSSTLTEHTTTQGTLSGDSNGNTGEEEKARPKTSIFKLPGFLRKNDEPSSLPTSQQSSVVGLDWLFSTDSDSLSSGIYGTFFLIFFSYFLYLNG